MSRDYTVLETGPAASVNLADAIGRNLWDMYPPSAREAFEPAFEEAWAEGHICKLVYWNKILTEIQATVRDGRLLASYAYTTIDGLEEALEAIMADFSAV